MNVVGRVGSLISQGVYSVATPFHPFGGAVDIIVVQQQDGTFRSTPWYVRFGKFQGVLKGAEKMVGISVNGIEANFHMYLDNSGEAYFVREVSSGEGSGSKVVLKDSDSFEGTKEESSVSDNNNVNSDNKDNNSGLSEVESVVSNGEVQLQDERVLPLGVDRIERTESDCERRFYEFQDGQSSLEDSEYGSSRFDNLESVEQFVESQNLSSEVILVSIDGHILTAPITSSERDTENVQLNTPQFHLGPGQEADFCEGNANFNTGEETWAADYLGDLGTTVHEVASENTCSANNASNDFVHQLEVCEGDGEHICQVQKHENIADQEREICADKSNGNLEAAVAGIRRDDVFQSCLELTSLVVQDGNANQQEVNSLSETHENAAGSQERSLHSLGPADEVGDGDVGQSINTDGLTLSNSGPTGSTLSPDLQVEVELIEDKASDGHMDSSDVSDKASTGHMDSSENVFDKTSTGHMDSSDNISVHSVTHGKEPEEQVDNALAVEGTQCSPHRSDPEEGYDKSEFVEPQTEASDEGIKTNSRIEISLCGNLLHTGMGLDAAAEVFNGHRISEGDFKLSASSITKNENLVVRFQDRYLPWDKAAPIVLGVAAYDLDLPVEPKDAIPVDQDKGPKPGDEGSGLTSTPGRRWRLWPNPFRRVKTLEHTSSNSSSEEVFVDSESGSQNLLAELTPKSTGSSDSPHKQLLRTNVPTTEQIASLKLKDGQNMVTFKFSTRVWGMQEVDAHIYLWKYNARIVISDVDGTITKSDVLGQFMPLVGKDWTQSGVARLFSAIKENGYQLLFLSARAIVQAYLTRSFLLNLKQDGKALPNGPVVISPDGLFPSLYREVIRRAPHEFKIACLEDIKALFPSNHNPFYAGFGNRDTDELSYRKMGIPKGKIFIINPKGEVAISHRIDVKSYTSLHTLVNDMFPPTSMIEQEEYNSWNYWRMPVPDLD